jgi:hypothetical protein
MGNAWADYRAIACNKEMRVKVPFDRARVERFEVMKKRVSIGAINVHFGHHPEFHALRRARWECMSTWWYVMRKAGMNSNQQPVICLEHHYLLLGKLCDLGVCARLLSAELIAGEREDLKPAPRELIEE